MSEKKPFCFWTQTKCVAQKLEIKSPLRLLSPGAFVHIQSQRKGKILVPLPRRGKRDGETKTPLFALEEEQGRRDRVQTQKRSDAGRTKQRKRRREMTGAKCKNTARERNVSHLKKNSPLSTILINVGRWLLLNRNMLIQKKSWQLCATVVLPQCNSASHKNRW